MTDDALLLIGRDAGGASEVYKRHADRLRDRGVADSVHVATYERNPQREVRDEIADISAARTYAVPMCVAHTNESTDALPAAFAAADGEIQYCEPVGRSPALTRGIVDRASECEEADTSTTLVLVGFGNTTGSYQRQVVEYHAANLREQTAYADVVPCYLTQSPAVECVRYNIPTESAVAVPLFIAPNAATEDRIPAKLELDRGGIAYAEPFGTHRSVTDAITDRLETQRVVAEATSGPASFEAALAETARPLATDGNGRPR